MNRLYNAWDSICNLASVLPILHVSNLTAKNEAIWQHDATMANKIKPQITNAPSQSALTVTTNPGTRSKGTLKLEANRITKGRTKCVDILFKK